jgi:hypothetical protein
MGGAKKLMKLAPEVAKNRVGGDDRPTVAMSID